jgi:hypothetical protein
MEGSKTLFCSSKFPWIREIISSKFIDVLGTRPQNILQPWSLHSFRPVSTGDLVTLKSQTHKHPPLATSPHPLGPSASSGNSCTGQKRSDVLYLNKCSLNCLRDVTCYGRKCFRNECTRRSDEIATGDRAIG